MLFLRWASIVVFALCLLAFALPASAASPEVQASVAGKWNLTVTFPDGHSESSQVIFNQNGTFVNLTPGPGGGKWVASGTTFSYVFSEVFLNASGVYTTLVEIEQVGKLSGNGKTFTASGNGSVYDASTGNLLTVNHTTTTATRA